MCADSCIVQDKTPPKRLVRGQRSFCHYQCFFTQQLMQPLISCLFLSLLWGGYSGSWLSYWFTVPGFPLDVQLTWLLTGIPSIVTDYFGKVTTGGFKQQWNQFKDGCWTDTLHHAFCYVDSDMNVCQWHPQKFICVARWGHWKPKAII